MWNRSQKKGSRQIFDIGFLVVSCITMETLFRQCVSWLNLRRRLAYNTYGRRSLKDKKNHHKSTLHFIDLIILMIDMSPPECSWLLVPITLMLLRLLDSSSTFFKLFCIFFVWFIFILSVSFMVIICVVLATFSSLSTEKYHNSFV